MHVMDGTSARCESLRLHKFNNIVDKMLVCSVHLACTQKRGSNLFIFNIDSKFSQNPRHLWLPKQIQLEEPAGLERERDGAGGVGVSPAGRRGARETARATRRVRVTSPVSPPRAV